MTNKREQDTQANLMEEALADVTFDEAVDEISNVPKGVTHKYSLYALGGCGIKIAAMIPDVADLFNVTTIDTSQSEDALLTGNINRIYLADDKDGSGAVKAAKYSVLKAGIPPVVESTDPTDVCFVAFSISGASGSTAAYILIEELIKLGKSVVAIASLNASNELRTKNSLKTLLGLHNLAAKSNVNLPLYLGMDTNLVAQDRQSAAFILAASAMLNPGVVGVDATDRTNFLSPCNIKDINLHPSLLSISLTYGTDTENADISNFASSLVLTPIGADEGVSKGSKVTFAGLLDQHIKEYLVNTLGIQGSDFDNISLNTSFEPPYKLIGSLKVRAHEYDKATTLQAQKAGRIMSQFKNNGDDIVL